MLSKSVGALVFGLVLMLGVAKADDKEKKLSNPEAGKCPVSHKDIDPKVTVDVKDKTYAFCCEKCAAKFKEHPEKFLKEKKDK
jgi:YHS domain-containing protein